MTISNISKWPSIRKFVSSTSNINKINVVHVNYEFANEIVDIRAFSCLGAEACLPKIQPCSKPISGSHSEMGPDYCVGTKIKVLNYPARQPWRTHRAPSPLISRDPAKNQRRSSLYRAIRVETAAPDAVGANLEWSQTAATRRGGKLRLFPKKKFEKNEKQTFRAIGVRRKSSPQIICSP